MVDEAPEQKAGDGSVYGDGDHSDGVHGDGDGDGTHGHSLAGRRVAVTGATGFLGSHIALALLGAGAHVVGVVRRPERGAWLAERGIELRRADLLEPDALSAAFAGCDAVVSNAAMGSGQGDLADFERVNLQGSGNVFDAVEAQSIRRVVAVSTVAVYRTRLGHPMAEDAEPAATDRRRFTWSDLTTDWRYARTKTLAEQLAWRRAEGGGLQLTALRPGPVYGSRDGKLTARYLRMLERAVCFAPTVGVPHVHAGDVAAATVQALLRAGSVGRAYNLAGPPRSPLEALRILKVLRGGGATLVPLPVPLHVEYDCSAAARDLGFVSRDLVDGLAEAWHGRLDSTAG